jgi:hypothetical protein
MALLFLIRMKNKIQLFVAIGAFAFTRDILTSLLIGTAFWLLTVREININIKRK